MASDTTRTILLRSMAAVAGADGTVGDRELETIGEVYREVTGEEASTDEIRGIVEAGWSGDLDPAALVSSLGAGTDLDTRLAVAEACYRVLEADAEVTGPEARMFNEVLRGLGLSKKDVLDRL